MMRERRRSNISRDRWLVSYADFITLLFALFVVLFAFAKADQKKQVQVVARSTQHSGLLGVSTDTSLAASSKGRAERYSADRA